VTYNRTRQEFVADALRRLNAPAGAEVKRATAEQIAAHDAFWELDKRSDEDVRSFLERPTQ
jgi:hypothetical protein